MLLMNSSSHVNSSLLSYLYLSLLWQPESEAEVGAGAEGTSGGAMKRGLSLESAAAGQDVKRFRTAAGAASTVSSGHHYLLAITMWLSSLEKDADIITHWPHGLLHLFFRVYVSRPIM